MRCVDAVAGWVEWRRSIGIALMTLVFASPAMAEKGKLRQRLTSEVVAKVFPGGVERLGPEEGAPPAIAVFKDGKVVAFAFSTLDIVAAPGYSTTPFDVIAGVDLGGRITGAEVVFHNEPHIVHDPIRQRQLDTFLAREAGRPLSAEADVLPPDFVAGATVSARAMRAAVLASARLVLRARVPGAAVTVPTLDAEGFKLMSWDELIAEAAVVRRRVTAGEVAAALAGAGAADAKLDVPLGKPDDLYVEFATALFTPAAIGGNLLGLLNFEEYKRRLPVGAQAIIVASSGPYDFLGKKFFQDSEGHRFDRLRVVQDGQTFGFVQDDYQWASPYAGALRGQQNAGLFALPERSGFDPLRPWRLELLVNGAGATPATVGFGLDYLIPAAHVLMPERPPVAAWVEAWHDGRVNVAILAVLLSALTLIFCFQAVLSRSRRAHRLVRNGFLTVTLVWLGWTAGVQLSIVNVINYLRAPLAGLGIDFYLAEPLMLIIAGYTLLSVVLIGRGVFCGWLCPFGALQELLAQLARALDVPQWHPAAALEQRLRLGKYIAAVAVLILGVTALDASGIATEVEPFKTAITAKFTRAWPFVAYAGGLLAIGLFSERAYCRFLCPLGGVLALLDRLHLVNMLKRRPECGNPCRLCERSCPVGAIEKTGKIVTAECFQCLDCQVEYHDDQRCPPLVLAAKLKAGEQPAAGVPQNA